MAATKRVATLTRVSTEEQANEGNSLESQQAILRRFAESRKWEIVGEYRDDSTGTSDRHRPGLSAIMKAAANHDFDVLLVSKTDRFMRDLRLLKNYIYDLQQLGVDFVSATEPQMDLSTPTGKLSLNMLGMFAEFESNRIGERTKESRQFHKANAHWTAGRRPYGYGWNKETKSIVIDPLQKEAIQFIFDTYVRESVGVAAIAAMLNEKGYPAPTGGRRTHPFWTYTTVEFVLLHPCYAGGPSDLWPYKWPAIVSRELWDAARIKARNNYHFRTTKDRLPLQGLLRCGYCGRTLQRQLSHGNSGKRTWSCPGRLLRYHFDGSERCKLPRANAADLESKLADEMSKIFSNPELLEQYIEITLANLHKERQELERKLKPIQGNIKTLKDRIERATVVYRNGQSTTDQYEAEIKGLKTRIAELERQTNAADPMALRALKENEMAIWHWEAERKMQENPIMASGGMLVSEPDEDIREHPIEVGAKQLRKLNLYAYIYPDKIEIKGNLGQASNSSGTSTNRSLPFKAEIKLGGVAVG